MIQTFSSTIRRREMDAVLTCMVDEKIGPGEINSRLIQSVKEFFGCAGAFALRSPDVALKYAISACGIEKDSKIMVSALAPLWQIVAIKDAGYEPLILDVDLLTACVTPQIVEEGIKNGGRLLILHEPLGILPDFEGIKKAENSVPQNDEKTQEVKGKKAGCFGIFAICSLEEHDIITAGGGAIIMAAGRCEWPVLK